MRRHEPCTLARWLHVLVRCHLFKGKSELFESYSGDLIFKQFYVIVLGCSDLKSICDLLSYYDSSYVVLFS